MASGDFNGDGKLDLAATTSARSDIGVLLGNGDGSFQAPTYYAVGTMQKAPIHTGEYPGGG